MSNLCEVCRKLDIRKLLLDSAAQETTTTRGLLTGYSTLAALRAAAALKCEFCCLILQTRHQKEQDPRVDDWLDENNQGQIYVGTGSCSVAKRESPHIMVSQRPTNDTPRILCNFEAFTHTDANARRECTYLGRSISSRSDTAECYALANEWLQDCMHNHKDCGPLTALPSPTRIINVGSQASSKHPFLDVDAPRDHCMWAALSYQWGGSDELKLKAETFARLKSGIPVGDFPSTLRDAILITRELGLQYIWIDALCIFQDSEDDWNAEAGRMRDVYAGAAITIVAANSLSTAAGIHAERPLETDSNGQCQLAWSCEETVLLRPASHISQRVANSSPWFTRGWTFQEGLLSPRTLSYGRDQLVWECAHHTQDESGHINLLEQKYGSKDLLHKLRKSRRTKTSRISQLFSVQWFMFMAELQNQRARFGFPPSTLAYAGVNMQDEWGMDPYLRWCDIVEEFSVRKFTVATDILPALSGIAQEFALITRDTYCAGMWKTYMLVSLLWWRQSLLKPKKEFPIDVDWFSHIDWKKPEEYKAPSWSWASLNAGRVTLPIYTVVDAPSRSMAAIINIDFHTVGHSPFGKLLPGSALVMKGCLFPIHNIEENYWRWRKPAISHPQYLQQLEERLSLYTGTWPALQECIQERINGGNADSFEFEQQHVAHPNQTFGAFLLVHTEGLVTNSDEFLISGTLGFLVVESTGHHENEYRRIGAMILTKSARYAERALTSFSEAKGAERRGEFTWSATIKEREHELEAKVWEQIPKTFPRRTTIRLI
ncbi:heterokaryon incompatibility protein [Rutstroemia sp. NJR-2017a WRK4]|nr:heterokaryon incompatibility protein [Rutstroemia sp. NJR-2017a WRK4]